MREDWPNALRLAFDDAEAASRELGHGYIGSEHVLLGLLRSPGTRAYARLERAGITYAAARRLVVHIVGTSENDPAPHQPPFTPNAAHVAQRVLGESERAGGPQQIGSEHILRALLRRRECIAVLMLSDLGADPPGLANTLRRPQADSR